MFMKEKNWHQQLFPFKLCLERKIDWPEHFLLLNSFILTPDFLSVCIYPGDDDNSLVLNFEGFKNTVNIFRGLGGFSFCLSGVLFVCGFFGVWLGILLFSTFIHSGLHPIRRITTCLGVTKTCFFHKDN